MTWAGVIFRMSLTHNACARARCARVESLRHAPGQTSQASGFDDETFEAEVERYVAGFERVSRSWVMLSKELLYHMDGMTFDTALQPGMDVNNIARMTEDCQKWVANFLKKNA